MGSSENKGDSSTSTIALPPEVEALAMRNLKQAERAGKIGYVPYQGPTMAALTPGQTANMANNRAMAGAFGLRSPDPTTALPAVKTYAGGVQGYDPMALYLGALDKIPAGQRRAIQSFVMNPKGGGMRGQGKDGEGGTPSNLTTPSGEPYTGASRTMNGVTYRYDGNTWVPAWSFRR